MTSDVPTDLSVVIVCWNNKGYLEPCLRSLFGAGLTRRLDVVVVDNGSTDGGPAMVREQFPAVTLVENDHNAGLARASNQGIRATSSQYVLLLNDDTLVDGASLEAMAACLDAEPRVAAVGGRLVNPDGSFQAGYAAFSTLGQELAIATGLGAWRWPGYPAHRTTTTPGPVDWISSACLLLRRDALDQVGLLDEQFVIYGDEVDLQWRLHRAGWEVFFLPDAVTTHYGGRSLDRWRRRRMVYRGKMLFYDKNRGRAATLALRILLAVLSAGKVMVWCLALVPGGWRERARRELRSNLDVLRLCWSPA